MSAPRRHTVTIRTRSGAAASDGRSARRVRWVSPATYRMTVQGRPDVQGVRGGLAAVWASALVSSVIVKVPALAS